MPSTGKPENCPVKDIAGYMKYFFILIPKDWLCLIIPEGLGVWDMKSEQLVGTWNRLLNSRVSGLRIWDDRTVLVATDGEEYFVWISLIRILHLLYKLILRMIIQFVPTGLLTCL